MDLCLYSVICAHAYTYTCVSITQCHVMALETQFPFIKFLSIFSIYFSFLLLPRHFQFLADVLNIIDVGFSVLHRKRRKVIGQVPGGTSVASKVHSNIGEGFELEAGISADKASGRLATMLQQSCLHPYPSPQRRRLWTELSDLALRVLLLGQHSEIFHLCDFQRLFALNIHKEKSDLVGGKFLPGFPLSKNLPCILFTVFYFILLFRVSS